MKFPKIDIGIKTPTDKKELESKIEIQLCLDNYQYFREVVCGYSDFQPFHKEIDDVLLSGSKYKRIMIPRNHLKSSSIMSWCVWRLLHNPNLSFMYESSIYKQAKKYVGEIRSIIESDRFKLRFGDWVGTPWTDTDITISKRKISQPAPTISASGLDKTQTGQHYDYVILDDLVDENNSKTEDGRLKAINRYQNALSLLRPNGTIIVVGTPWDRDDLYGWIDKNPAASRLFETIKLDVYDKSGKIRFKEKFVETITEELHDPSKRSLESLRIQYGPYAFSCQYRINPDAEDFGEFRPSWIRRINVEQAKEDLTTKRGIVRIFCDPAMGKENSTAPCDTAIIVTHFKSDHIIDVLGEDVQIIDPGSAVERLHKYAMNHLTTGDVEVYIEDVGFQGVMITQLERLRTESKVYYGIFASKPTQDKDRRIRGLFPYYRFGQIRHVDTLIGGKLEVELERFPKIRLKDAADALSQFVYMCNFPLQKKEETFTIFTKNAVTSMRAPLVKKQKQNDVGETSYMFDDKKDSMFNFNNDFII